MFHSRVSPAGTLRQTGTCRRLRSESRCADSRSSTLKQSIRCCTLPNWTKGVNWLTQVMNGPDEQDCWVVQHIGNELQTGWMVLQALFLESNQYMHMTCFTLGNVQCLHSLSLSNTTSFLHCNFKLEFKTKNYMRRRRSIFSIRQYFQQSLIFMENTLSLENEAIQTI